MDTPLQIVFDGMDSSDFVKTQIREKMQKMERIYDHIVDGRVVVQRDNTKHRKGPIYSLTIELGVPGKRLVVSNDPGDRHRHKDLEPLVNDSFAAMGKQLEQYAQKQRGAVKAHAVPLQGRITKLPAEEEYGFITLTDGREIYFHENSVVNEDFKNLEVNIPVRVVIAPEESPKGPQATTVEVINEMKYVDRSHIKDQESLEQAT